MEGLGQVQGAVAADADQLQNLAINAIQKHHIRQQVGVALAVEAPREGVVTKGSR